MKFHHPIHKFADNTMYFLTARIYGGQPIMKSDERKQLLLGSLKAGFRFIRNSPFSVMQRQACLELTL